MGYTVLYSRATFFKGAISVDLRFSVNIYAYPENLFLKLLQPPKVLWAVG